MNEPMKFTGFCPLHNGKNQDCAWGPCGAANPQSDTADPRVDLCRLRGGRGGGAWIANNPVSAAGTGLIRSLITAAVRVAVSIAAVRAAAAGVAAAPGHSTACAVHGVGCSSARSWWNVRCDGSPSGCQGTGMCGRSAWFDSCVSASGASRLRTGTEQRGGKWTLNETL